VGITALAQDPDFYPNIDSWEKGTNYPVFLFSKAFPTGDFTTQSGDAHRNPKLCRWRNRGVFAKS
jgi:hypothetical protein